MKLITVKHVEYIAFTLARQYLSWDEPIPDFSSSDKGVLQSCVSNAFQTYGKKELYPGFYDKASVLFYQMIKNHPFINGNKRIALTTLSVFLFINGKWIDIENKEIYEFAVWVAKSNPKAKRGTIQAIKDLIRKHTIDLKT